MVRHGLELSVEIRDGIKAAFITSFGNANVLFDQELARVAYPDLRQKIGESFVSVGFKIAAKGCSTHISNGGHLFKAYLFPEIFHHISMYFVHSVALGF